MGNSLDMPVRKAVIPAAGLGTRFLPATKAQPKEMLPLVDKPGIQYVVEEAISVGIKDILIITGRGKRSLEDHFDRSFELEYYLAASGKDEQLQQVREIAALADIHYVRQGEPKGLGHAILTARQHVGNEPFVVMLGDDVMSDESTLLKSMISSFHEKGSSIIAIKEVLMEEISSYGCIRGDRLEDNLVKILDIIEKPTSQEAPSNLAVTGRYVFLPSIFDSLEKLTPGKNGEIQLTDAIALEIEAREVYGYRFSGGHFDLGNKLDYLKATVEVAMGRKDIGSEFCRFLTEIIKEKGLL